jgi:hypothetical protein
MYFILDNMVLGLVYLLVFKRKAQIISETCSVPKAVEVGHSVI